MSIPVRETKRKIPGSMLVPLCKGDDSGILTTELYNMSSEIIKHYGTPSMKVIHLDELRIGHLPLILNNTQEECVAIIFTFELGTYSHFVPYVKIGNDWYNGDDQLGYLRRKVYEPSIDTPYFSSSEGGYSKIKEALVFSIESKDIRDNQYSSGRSLTGIPTPGQTGVSCGSDSLQVVFMWANGYRNNFVDIFKRISDYPEVIKGGELLNLETTTTKDIITYVEEEKDKILTRASLSIPNTEVDRFFIILLLKYKSFELEPRPITDGIPENMSGAPGNERGTAAAYNMHMMEEEQKPKEWNNKMEARIAALKRGGKRSSYKKTRKSKKTRKHKR
jgi:hypothetical protein